MSKVGFTTGSTYRIGKGIDESVKLYSSFGADAIELIFVEPSELLEFELSDETTSNLKKYGHVSIHAPWKEIRYDKNKDAQEVMDKLKEMSEKINTRGIVLHPDIIDNFSFLENNGLPFLLENMDRRKKFGTKLEDFEKLKRDYNLRFVLDTHHAYGCDLSMKLGFELLELFGDRLDEMHVSGANSTGDHHPVYFSVNRDKIVEILRLGIKVPKILEGHLSYKNFEQEIPKELDFIRSYEQ